MPKIDPIEYLVERKFPIVGRIKAISTISPRNKRILRHEEAKVSECESISAETIQAIRTYRKTLAALPSDELEERYRHERDKNQAADDEERFFNNPQADADFDYWSKMPYWSLDEAVALSFGKAPEVVNKNSLKSVFSWVSPFVREYNRTHELAARAVKWRKLFDPVMPRLYVNWAHDNDISLPDKLVAKVEARSETLIDWQARYDEVLARNNQNVDKANKLLDAANARIAELEESAGVAKPLHTKERESLLKLVAGMAIGGYGYDPGAARSTTTGEIADDLAKAGVSLDVDTVRKWLSAASELLPRGDPGG